MNRKNDFDLHLIYVMILKFICVHIVGVLCVCALYVNNTHACGCAMNLMLFSQS